MIRKLLRIIKKKQQQQEERMNRDSDQEKTATPEV